MRAQVRRAYKKAALALHPDKALAHCRFAPRMGVPAPSWSSCPGAQRGGCAQRMSWVATTFAITLRAFPGYSRVVTVM